MNEFNNFEMDALSTVSMDDLNAALAAGNIEEQAAMPAPVELTCNWEDVRKFVSAIIPEGNLFEIRTIPKAGDTSWRVCVKNTSEGLDTAINGLVHKELYKSTLYMTLQSIQQDAQCLHNYGKVIPNKSCVKDADIDHYQWLYIDIDPKHPSGTQATDEEMIHAEAVAEQVNEYLSNKGFPDPVYAFTGNGRAIYYHINLPADTEHKQLISRFLKALNKEYSTDGAEIDTSVCNPARITKLIGCPSCKGENTPERPHRMSKLLSVPDEIGEVSAEQLQAVIDELTPKKESKQAVKAREAADQKKTAMIADVKAWLDSHSIVYRKSEFEKDGKTVYKYELEDCPFTEHDNNYSSAVFWEPSGKTTFHCFHNSCGGHTIHDMLAKYPLVDQIQLFDGKDPKMGVYNEVVKNCKFIVSQDNQKYILPPSGKLMWFDGSETDRYITSVGKELGLMLSKAGVATVHLNLETLFDDYAVSAYVANRAAFADGILYYYLEHKKIVMISPGKVEIVSKPHNGVYFYQNDGMLQQCAPDLSTPASELTTLIKQVFNVPDNQLLEFIGVLVGFYFPHIPTPLLVLSGGQGTSKTVSCRNLISLIDPVIGDIGSLPEKEDSLHTDLSTNYLSVFDNVSNISSLYSEILCKAITGATAKKRKYYTNNEQVLINIRSKVILNGIGDLIKKTDLAERSCIIYPEIIPKSARRTEEDVNKTFNELKPRILGAVFNAIAGGLKNHEYIKEEANELPRLADYAVYAAACIKAMGLSWKDFLNDYQQATDTLIGEQMEFDPLTNVIISFLLDLENNTWSGMPSELLDCLNRTAKNKGITMENYSPSSLSRKLGQMQVSLSAAGINFSRDRKKDRVIELSMNRQTQTVTDVPDTEQS